MCSVILLESDVPRHTEIGNDTLTISWLWLLEGDWTGKKTAGWTSEESQAKFDFRSRPRRQLFLGRQQLSCPFASSHRLGPLSVGSLGLFYQVPEKFSSPCYSLLTFGEKSDNWKIPREMGIPDHLTCLLRNLYAGQEATVRAGHGKTDWFQIGKEYVKAVYCHPAYLTYMQSTSWETLGWMKHKLESRLPG